MKAIEQLEQQIVITFLPCSKKDKYILNPQCLQRRDNKKTGEEKAIITAYTNLLDLKKSGKSFTYDIARRYEPDIRFIISHHFFLDNNALLHIMPIILMGYVYLEEQGKGEFDAVIPFYSCLIEWKYGYRQSLVWSKPQSECIEHTLEYVFTKSLTRGYFDDILFCVRILFSEDLAFINQVLSITDARIVKQVSSFLEQNILFWCENSHCTADAILSAIMYYSRAVPCTENLSKKRVIAPEDVEILSEYLPNENSIRHKIMRNKRETVSQYLSEDQIFSYILTDQKRS
jgi:hypothetical protein